ncbi:MAG: PaaI family thioesterase [Planctomycetes bacterium]|nr:PaaI family thioesterase [Planctomycetota bacterium]
MPAFVPQDPDFEARVRASFARQRFMATLGARLVRVEPGLCEIELAYQDGLTQQHGYLHAGAVTSIADSAGGYAAYSLMPADSSVLAVEFKINLLEPAKGQRFVGRGRVVRAGKRLSVCELEVEACDGGRVQRCLLGIQTVMCLAGHADDSRRG